MDELNPLALPSYTFQNVQNRHRPIDYKHRKKLEPQYELALEFRLDGYNYEIITRELKRAGYNYSEWTIRDWFKADGSPSLKALYDEIKERNAKEAMEEFGKARETLNKDVPMALAVLHRGINDKQITKTQIETAREILDRAGFGRQIKQDGNMQVESESLKSIATAIKDIAKRQS